MKKTFRCYSIYCMYKKFCSVLLFLLIVPSLYSQEKIISFDNNWTIDLSLNYHYLLFDQEDLFGCRGNKPLDVGIGIRYKKIALGYDFELPFFSEYYAPSSQSFDLNFDYIAENYIATAFLIRYNSFFVKENQFTDLFRDSEVNLDILQVGLTFRWALNSETYTLRGVYKLDRKQTISGGSPILGFGVYYHSIYSADDKLPGYDTKQHFIYSGLLVGYSYTWILGSGAFFNNEIVGGINPGFNTDGMKYIFIPSLFPKLTFGFHFNSWSIISSVDVKFFITMQSYEVDSADWHQLSKINITLLKVSVRF